MIQLEGKYSDAIVYSDHVEESAISQILELLNHPVSENAHPRFMPDIHAGAGCVIGTTMHLTNKVVPNLIGVDIGCGVRSIFFPLDELPTEDQLSGFDRAVRERVPAGMGQMHEEYSLSDDPFYDQVIEVCKRVGMDEGKALRSLGTLGGGNHFIEMGQSVSKPYKYALTVHTGSRGFGHRVATYYQQKAIEYCEQNKIKVNRAMAYLEGEAMQEYLRDMKVAQQYARYNIFNIGNLLLTYWGWEILMEDIEVEYSVHNCIGGDDIYRFNKLAPSDNIIRKGAIRANDGEKIIIPLNMRDGIILAKGKGNPEWNNSAPHGAGRVLARGEAKRTLDLADFESAMQGIWSSSISTDTIDESPMAYKDSTVIESAIGETVEIIDRFLPIYSFKAGR